MGIPLVHTGVNGVHINGDVNGLGMESFFVKYKLTCHLVETAGYPADGHVLN